MRSVAMIFGLLSACASWALAADPAEGLWTGFRRAYPFHVQTLALSDRDEAGGRTLIIAEPPPSFGRATAERTLHTIFGDRLRHVAFRRHPIGYDGWVEDAIVTLGPSGTSAAVELKQLRYELAELSLVVFGTAYKVHVERLPAVGASGHVKRPQSLSVRAGEIKAWLVDRAMPLAPLNGGETRPLRELFARGETGVFLSQEPGLAVLVLRRDVELGRLWSDLRKFALDADLVLGAVAAGENGLALVGRERAVPVTILPPLRVESILTLAAAASRSELHQSYERTHVFAGKLLAGEDKSWDWAPIYLSAQLIDTEVGSLFNLTDQLLKSWSEAGHIEYVRFPYPRPASFPFEGIALSKKIGGAQVLFNWNTTGFGSVVDFGEIKVFSIARTGALPITYGSDVTLPRQLEIGMLKKDEDEAWDYFCEQRDQHLIRAVQYTALFQIFHAFPIKILPAAVESSHSGVVEHVLQRAAFTALRQIASGEAKPSKAYLDQEVDKFRRLSGSDGDYNAETGRRAAAFFTFELDPTQEFVKRIQDQLGPEALASLADHLADPRGNIPTDAAVRQLAEIADASSDDLEVIEHVGRLPTTEREAVMQALWPPLTQGLKGVIDATTNLLAIRDAVATAAAREPAGYVRTASVVLSRDRVEADAIGGHDLNGKATEIEINLAVPRGKAAIVTGHDGNAVLRINPADAVKSDELARAFERNPDLPEAELRNRLEALLAEERVVRPIETALALGPVDLTSRLERGLTRDQQGAMAVGLLGWRIEPVTKQALDARATRADGKYQIELERDGDTYLVLSFIPRPPRAVRILSGAEFKETLGTIAVQAANSNIPLKDGLVIHSETIPREELQALTATMAGGGGRGGFVGDQVVAAPFGRDPIEFRMGTGTTGTPRTGGYIHHSRTGGVVFLNLLGKRSKPDLANRIKEPLDWNQAKIEPVDTTSRLVTEGEFKGLLEVSWRITIPVKPRPQETLAMRVIAFFKTALSRWQVAILQRAIERSLAASKEGDLVGVAAFAELKADLRNISEVEPEAVRFHLEEGGDDLIIVELFREAGVGTAG